MGGRRLIYLLLLTTAAAYFLASGEWIAWILLITALGMPWLSLLLSLPAIWKFQASPAGAGIVEQGEDTELWLMGSCPLPMPPFRGYLRVYSFFTGKESRYIPERGFSTEHCGGYRITVEKVRVCDYLGLFSFPARKTSEQRLLVCPKALPVEDMVIPERMEIRQWIPKSGGGFSENHEHRLYRPGDRLNQLHWKLSAKVGDLILREPMQAVQGAVLLTLTLSGTPRELDRKLGRLAYAGAYLLERELDFEIRAMTGSGILVAYVDSEDTMRHTMDQLLCSQLATGSDAWDAGQQATWQYHIGGDADEA